MTGLNWRGCLALVPLIGTVLTGQTHTAQTQVFHRDPAVRAPARKSRAIGQDERIAARWLNGMTLHEQVAQLVTVQFSGRLLNPRSREFQNYVRLVSKVGVGGMILINVAQGRLIPRAEPMAVASFLNKMQKIAKVPLIVSGDFERGASMRVDATTVFPHAMAFTAGRDPGAAYYEGEITAREARALGFHWVFFPVADVNNNPDNPIINIRSFGENPQDVSLYDQAFIEGTRADRRNLVLTTVKHFPGHGDTSTDSHMHRASIQGDRKRLAEVEFVPFRAAIARGVDAVMTAHISVPALESADVPATLSPLLLTKVLREELGFRGIIVTDALEMGGIAKGFSAGEAAVRAIEAGVDVLLIPPDPEAAINAVVAAVQGGRLTHKRIQESAMRVLAAKARLGLAVNRLVDLDAVGDVVNSPEANIRAQQIADKAVTLVKNRNNAVPLRDPAKTCFLILTESRTSVQGQVLAQEVQRRAPAASVVFLDNSMPDAELNQAAQQTAACDAIAVSAFVTVAAYRGAVALGGGFPALMTKLIASGKPMTLVALGNPYLLRNFPDVSAYMTTYSTVPPSEIAAVKALFGEISIEGRLPITIPGLAAYGDGIRIAPVAKSGAGTAP